MDSIQEDPGDLLDLRHCRRSRNHRTRNGEGSHSASCPERAKDTSFTAHLGVPKTYLETGDIAVAEVLAQVLHLLQLEEVDTKHLDRPDHQVVHLLVLREEGLLVSLLVLHEGLNVLVETVARWALGRLCGQLTLLEEQGKEGEERVLVDRPLVLLQLGLLVLTSGGIVLLEAGGGGRRGGRWPPIVTWATHLIPGGQLQPPLKQNNLDIC